MRTLNSTDTQALKPLHKQLRFWAGLYLLISAVFPFARKAFEAYNAKRA